MESAERLVSPTSSQTSIRAAANPETSPTTTHSKSGHLFQMFGNQGLGISSVSGAFPMISHPVFSLHSSSPVCSEFGGLGTLGLSAALAARSQIGALPDWWCFADAQGQGSAAFFPHLLGLPALFSAPALNQEQPLLQSHAARRAPVKGLNGSINGKAKSSSASTPSPVLIPPDQTKNLKTSPKPALNQLEEKTRPKTKDEKPHSKVPDVSINSDSQSASSSDSSSDALSSSDSDDLEDDDDDDDDQSDDSVDSEKCRKDQKVIRKEEMHTDRKKSHHTVGQDKLDVQGLLLSQLPIHIQSFRPTEEPSKQASVIQATGLASSAKPLALVMQRRRDSDAPSPTDLPVSHSSSPKPPSLTPSPKSLSLTSSPTPPYSKSTRLKTCKNDLDQTLLTINNFSKLKQSSLPQAFPPPLRGAQESQSSQKLPFNSPFLPSLPTENHHPSAVQGAPLALITKPRSQSTRTPDKPLLAATSPAAFNTPINLTTTGRTSTSPALKRERPSLVEHFSGAESELPYSKDSDDSLMEDEDENYASNDSLSDSDSNLDTDSDDDDDDDGKDEEMDTDSEMDRTPLKLTKSSVSILDSSHSTSPAPLNLQVHKTPATTTPAIVTGNSANHSPALSSYSVVTPPGKRRRVTDECALRKPLENGWQRETRIRNMSGRLRGEVAYYTPCGRKLRQYADVIKYLTRNGISDITRDNFSFSAKIKVGDFYEARDGPQGLQWCLLKEEEVVPRILVMEGRRGHLKNLDPALSRRKSRAPDESEADAVSSSEAKLLRRLEAQEMARQAAQMKLMRKLEKQALARAAKEARRQQAIMAAEERRKHKEQMKILKQQEKFKRIQQVRLEKELRARQILEAKRKKKEEAENAKILETEKRIKEKELRRQQAIILKHQELERHRLDMERERRRQHVMLMKAIEARKKAEEKERLKQEKRDEKRLNKERKLELRRLELEMAKELNKPNEDMCLSDHTPLPALSRIAGLLLPGGCFSDCLMVMQFLRCFGKVLGFDLSTDVPSLSVLQAGLLNVGDSMGFIQDLLVRMLSAAVCDPGLPAGHRAKTALGDHVTNVGLNRDNVSEVLQIYMEAHCGQTELAPLAESLKTKAFQAHTPSQKASMLAFLGNELSCSKSVVSEIDKNIDSMTNLRRDKWVIEGNLRKLRSIYAKRTGKRESSVGGEEGQSTSTPANSRKRKRKGGESDEDDEEDDDSDEQGEEDEDEDDFGGKKGKKAEACDDEDEGDQITSIEELERQIEKLSKQQTQIRRKLFEASHSLRSVMFGQDRYKRRYWVLPQCGGIFVEGLESGEGPEELQRERERTKNAHLVQVKEEPDEKYGTAERKQEPPQDVDSLNLFLQKPDSFSKLNKLLEVAKMSSEVSCHQYSSPKQQTTLRRTPNHVVKPDLSDSCLLNNTYLTNAQQQICSEQLYKVLTERNAHWFSLLPRSPCDVSSLTEGPHSASSSSPQTTAVSADPYSAARINNFSLAALQLKSGVPIIDLPFCAWSNGNLSPNVPFSGVSMAQILRGIPSSSEGSRHLNVYKSDSPESPAEKPISTPSPVIEVPKNQDYPSPQPIPEEMLTGWWKVTDVEELRSIEKACHSRGIREKQLQKQLQKHMDYIGQVCSRNRDVNVIDVSELEENQASEDTVQSWCVEEQAMDMDIGVLQQVEELEHKVTSASLQVKGWMHPVVQSQSEDLLYYEHKPVVQNCKDKSDSGIVRRVNNPLDIAVTRLAELERNIERRYLKSPLSSTVQIRLDNVGTVSVPAPAPSPARADGDGAEEDLAPGLRQWRKALSEVCSASQLALCLQQLHKSIAWEKSIMKVYCQICCKGDNEELLLLCDGCDRGCHTYCHKPRITTIPDGDWFCPACISQASSQSLKTKQALNRSSGGLKKPAEAKRHKKPSVAGDSEENLSGANSTPRKVSKDMKKRKTEDSPSTNPAKQESPKISRDHSKDLTLCRILLAELESHQDAGPFLTPVNPKSVPGYRKIIKKPMDFSTIRDKLTNSQYLNLETFIIDVNLVFDNCEKFNEDNSDIGRAGHEMRRFFQRRWTELLRQNSLKPVQMMESHLHTIHATHSNQVQGHNCENINAFKNIL
ncbi:bromodomain adjacent to zinc finger domain protein 2B-like isoform X2 [Sinocyclocheilus anshuiensis]|uniref:bromodomain adjacent to zinc finger domain protein 2B-like isoform X2 n=1 Tax=Sinocyclocheilus anshuiensis TaxID=1608454 RepID=UPI0007B9B55A|nr:PREDICTED: bromodomain adjacent to zinc finger domain protein 2B-like isoform X2 [Sinocyclocheilus anshuiensis]